MRVNPKPSKLAKKKKSHIQKNLAIPTYRPTLYNRERSMRPCMAIEIPH